MGEQISGLTFSWLQLIYGLLFIALGILTTLTALIIQSIEVSYLILSGNIFIVISAFSLLYTSRHIRNIGAKIASLLYIFSNFVFVVAPLIYVVFTRRLEEVRVGATNQEWANWILMQFVFLLCCVFGFVKIRNHPFLSSIASRIAFKEGNSAIDKSIVFGLMVLSGIALAYAGFKGFTLPPPMEKNR